MARPLSAHRCPRCEIRRALCFCDRIPRIATQTRLVVLMHTAEEVLPTNTARLASKALANSEIRIRGRKDQPMSCGGLARPGQQAVLLYPSHRAVELNADFAARLDGPAALVVPDGSWAQTRQMVRREPVLAELPHVKLPPGPPSEYRLRLQPSSNSLCTLEAIARALGILENPAAQAQLEQLLRVLVERTLWARGMLSADQCTTAGIPGEAFFE
ncbi:MAG: tRNA-uridine aminocarboxypropyltransferase [Pirellulales bacterium]